MARDSNYQLKFDVYPDLIYTSILTLTLTGREVYVYFMCTCSFSPGPRTSVPAFTLLYEWPLFLQQPKSFLV